MSGGLVALFDDVAALAKLAAASVDDVGAAAGRASSKAAGVIIDDAAVTPRYVDGLDPSRELAIIKRIAKGSIRNKLIIILPVILLLNAFLPQLLTPLLMLGGTYLCFEGAEKIWHALHPHHGIPDQPQAVQSVVDENTVVSGAVRTDLILSAEIMVISLYEVAAEAFWTQAAVLVVVAFAITALVYGAVGLIVRMDDIGLSLTQRSGRFTQRSGFLLVKAMPKVMGALSTIGVVAMLWVGGHIVLNGTHELGWHWLYERVHDAEHWVAHLTNFADGVWTWLINTLASAAFGLLIGALVVAVVNGIKLLRR